MDFISFALAYGLVWMVSKLPHRILYGFSDFIFFILYYLAGYRKKTVYSNISRSFPEMTEPERRAIMKRFYRYFCDMSLETFASQNWPHTKLIRRYRIMNPGLVNSLAAEGRNFILTAGHYGNWEWLRCFSRVLDIHFIAIYKPLHNKYFDRWLRRVRIDRVNTIVPMDQTLQTIIRQERMDHSYLLAMIADQRPMPDQVQHWLTFMNQDTPVFLGSEKLARKFGQVVLFMDMSRPRRGFYEINLRLITDNPVGTRDHEITDTYFKMLEETIRNQPELYLWSHKRWKYARTEKNEIHPAGS